MAMKKLCDHHDRYTRIASAEEIDGRREPYVRMIWKNCQERLGRVEAWL